MRLPWPCAPALLSVSCTLGACQPRADAVTQDRLDAAGADVPAHVDAGGAADSAVAAPSASDAQVVARPANDAGNTAAVSLRLPDPFVSLPHGEEQRARLCAAGQDDLVTDAFCGGTTPHITSLADLLALLDVSPNVYTGSRGFAITGHSTALSKRSVSALNPRVIFVHTEATSDPLLAVGFARGEPMVEIVTRSRARGELQFYAVAFTLPCSESGRRCTPGELLTPAIERDWQRVDVYHEEDLKNTTSDCRACHQPAGPGTTKLLRMQEIDTPWTHWFDTQTRGGRALIEDYQAAHGDEVFAGIPGALVPEARGGVLAAFVRIGGSREQPNAFPSGSIEAEIEVPSPDSSADNQIGGRSQIWQGLYAAAQRGEAIPVPYHAVKITDARKLSAMQHAYAEYRAGRLSQAALPDIRDVLPDDAVTLAEMGLQLDERLDDRALLTAGCSLCHNARLDQSLSRARFHTDLEKLTPEAKQTAIDRLNLPGDDPLAMPPRRVHGLTEAVRARLVALLRH